MARHPYYIDYVNEVPCTTPSVKSDKSRASFDRSPIRISTNLISSRMPRSKRPTRKSPPHLLPLYYNHSSGKSAPNRGKPTKRKTLIDVFKIAKTKRSGGFMGCKKVSFTLPISPARLHDRFGITIRPRRHYRRRPFSRSIMGEFFACAGKFRPALLPTVWMARSRFKSSWLPI